jgi:FKBP-type peptidyl-prolyl cis-trans isomerase FkpA
MNRNKILIGTGKIGLIVSIILLVFNACEKQKTSFQLYEEEQEKLQQYIDEHNITTEPKASGLYYIETQAGTGEQVSYGRTVTVKYTGKFLNDTVFDSNAAYDFVLGVTGEISGWHEGISYMKDGGKATLIIPSSIGYGVYGSGPIGPYTTLVFDIEVTNVQ